MISRILLRALISFAVIMVATVPTLTAQGNPEQATQPTASNSRSAPNPAQTNAPLANGGPPKFLYIVHQELKPGKTAIFEDAETSLARSFSRANVPFFWVELQSMTGPSEALQLSSFSSAEEMANSMEASNAALRTDPRLKQAQDRLMQDNVSSATTVLCVRRDDMGYRSNRIELSKMRLLRVTTIFGHPGYERAFTEAEWSLSQASEKANAQEPWAVYEVVSGLPLPSFLIVTPMQSANEIDIALQTNQAIKAAQGGAVEEYLQELARIAYGTSDTRFFTVRAAASNVSKEFAASDPGFWSPPAVPSSPSPAIGKKQAAKRVGADTSKP